MRERGPLFRKGDRESASGRRLQLYLRKQLGMLEARMRATGQRFGRFKATLPDGTKIAVTAILNGPVPQFIVRAFAPPAARARRCANHAGSSA